MIQKRPIILFISICAMLIACIKSVEEKEPKYLRHIGDTVYNPLVDDPEFEACHEDLIFQYYNFSSAIQYEGEKYAIIEAFDQKYTMEPKPGETGFITIRFIVNCQGKTGWFRVEEVDTAYGKKEFNKDIVLRLLEITKELDSWKIGYYDERGYDYYQYLTFKMEDGMLMQIMP